MELRRPEVGSRARLGSSGGESAGKPPPGPKSQPRWGRQNGRLRTGVRRAIIADSLQIVPQSPPLAPALRAADEAVADALESVLSENTRRVYKTQWKLFDEWCVEMGLHSLPAEAPTVARYLAVRAGHESPGRDQGD